MNILQLNFEKGWRGGERQTMFCMEVFRAAGHRVELVARRGGALAQRAAEAGFVVHEYRNPLSLAAFLARRGRSFDIIHAQTANTVTWAVFTRWLHRRPIVFTRRTAFPVERGDEWKTGFKWRRVDRLVAIGEEAAREPRRMGLDTVVIGSAVQSQAIDARRVAGLIDEFDLRGRKVIATAAALTREKDPLMLIRAIGEVARRRNDFVFLHFGDGGDTEADAQQLVRELGLQDVYLFTGFRRGVEDFFSVMDVFAMSSRFEALGSSVLDALLYSVPVVSTDAGGLKECLADGRGILVPVGDHKAMANGIMRMLDDHTFRQQAVDKGYAYVRREHDVQIMGQRYLETYQALLDKRPGRQK